MSSSSSRRRQPEPPPLVARSRYGPYRVLRTIGQGGMGLVFEAEHGPSGRRVALKTVRVASARLLSTIRREIHALSRLDHPGVVRILDEGLCDGLPWYAMELCQGEPLRRLGTLATRVSVAATERLDDSPTRTTAIGEPSTLGSLGGLSSADTRDAGPLRRAPLTRRRWDRESLTRLLGVIRRLCAPLAYMHGEGLVHGDLKPDNILVRHDGTPVLVDFGLASRFSGEVSREALGMGISSGGTAWYVSPEQARGEPLDGRSDIYSLGCILYEMLTGRPPFMAETTREVLALHESSQPIPPTLLAEGLPRAIDDLVAQMLHKEPRQRYGHADSVAAVLRLLGADDPDAPAPRPRAYLYRPGLAGRERLLGQLRHRLDDLATGRGGSVMLGGESGVGKTRLLVALAGEAMRRGFTVLHAECGAVTGSGVRATANLPLRTILLSIADRCRERGAEETARILAGGGRVLAAHESSIEGLPGVVQEETPADLPAEEARLRFWRALATTVQRIAEEQPVVLVVDDVHGADELTLGFLRLLVRTGGDVPVLLLSTYRSEETRADLDALRSAPLVEDRPIGALSADQVAEMVGDMLALAPAPAALSQRLFQLSDGNPFFVAEYLRAAIAEGLLVRDGRGAWQVRAHGEELAVQSPQLELSLPSSVRELLARRLDRLSPRARQVAEAASVLGRETGTGVLEAVAGFGGPEMLDTLQELLAREVLEEPEPGILRFPHDQLRMAAEVAIPKSVLGRLHGAAAAAMEGLEEIARRPILANLARHWELAGDVEKACARYLEAARDAAHRHALELAERSYRRYLALAPETASESIEARNELGARILYVTGRMAEAVAEHERALALARAAGDAESEANSVRRLASVFRAMGRLREARTHGEAATAYFRVHDRQDLVASGLLLLGEVSRALGDLDRADGEFREALAIARVRATPQQEALALRGVLILEGMRGHFDEARRIGEEALAIVRATGERRAESNVLMALANNYGYQRQLDPACALLEEALAIQRQVGDRIAEAIALHNLGVYRHHQGRLADSQALLEEALAIRREIGARQGEAITLMGLALTRMNMGHVREANAAFEAALAIFEEVGDRENAAYATGALAMTERRLGGNLRLAVRRARAAGRSLDAIKMPLDAVVWLCERGHIALARGRSARPFLVRAERIAGGEKRGHGTTTAVAIERLRQAIDLAEAHRPLWRGEAPDNVADELRATEPD